ncbi:hypothetical protein Pmani_038647, partial [Petrolisthes manimaculis]
PRARANFGSSLDSGRIKEGDDLYLECHVRANPSPTHLTWKHDVSFRWSFNTTTESVDIPSGHVSTASNLSTISYTPLTPLDYGTLLCWATNVVGVMRRPCVFHIIPAGKPDRPGNCSVSQGRATSARVRCHAGDDGGLPQTFLLTATLLGGTRVFNITARKAPEFMVS